jgi:hypothetical protein
MRSCLISVFASALILTAAPPANDPKAVQIAKDLVQAMGGEQAWQKAHFVRFDFKVEAGGKTMVDRSHLWDKQTGRYRLDDKTKDGKPRVALFNLATQKGDVYVNGKKLEGAALTDALKAAYATYINDVYWLMMPWKWLDPGVHLKYLGQKTRGGQTYDVVELTFDHVGLTPGDRYDAWVSPKTHMMEHWDYTLQSGTKGSWDWQYTETAGVKLASNHKDDGKQIDMGNVKVLSTVDEALFTDPTKKL